MPVRDRTSVSDQRPKDQLLCGPPFAEATAWSGNHKAALQARPLHTLQCAMEHWAFKSFGQPAV